MFVMMKFTREVQKQVYVDSNPVFKEECIGRETSGMRILEVGSMGQAIALSGIYMDKWNRSYPYKYVLIDLTEVDIAEFNDDTLIHTGTPSNESCFRKGELS